MAGKDIELFENMGFGIVRKTDKHPNPIDFNLHNHDDLYEIMLFLSGDCEFRVEGNVYRLHPRDIVLTRPFELHRISFLSGKTYERIIIYIKPEYFKNHSCEKYLDILENRSLGTGNLIMSDVTGSAQGCIKRMLSYAQSGEYEVADKILFELLYLLNNSGGTLRNFDADDERVRGIIMYINEHLDGELGLDLLSRRFFLSKNYICSLFKRCTGYTINNYINHKRIMLVQELHRNGQTLIQASMEAGYKNYSNFYRAHMRLLGKPPRETE